MSQQKLDLRRSFYIVRRRKKIFGSVTAAGLLIGIAYSLLTLPMTSSAALVVVSSNPGTLNSQASATGTTISTGLATQIVIASSGPVLTAALPHASPQAESLQALGKRISVASVNDSDVLSITATGRNAEEAEETANAVANSYVAYVSASTNPAVYVAARVLESATTTAGSKLPQHAGVYAVLGAVLGALVGFVICLALDRGDRRLLQRDDIANSIAVPVLASIPVEHPSDPSAWVRLLNEYEPDAVHAYALRRLLHQFGVAGDATGAGTVSVTVLSLTSDPKALALGPQVAAFAAAQGIPTALVVGQQQDVNVTATLHTACVAGAQPSAEGTWSGAGKPLRLLAAEADQVDQAGTAFTVVVMVIDGHDPKVPATVRASATVLGVSAGGATAEELARAATAATADGRDIYGILVANPDPGDQTTGRIPRLAPVQHTLPTRVNGIATESRR